MHRTVRTELCSLVVPPNDQRANHQEPNAETTEALQYCGLYRPDVGKLIAPSTPSTDQAHMLGAIGDAGLDSSAERVSGDFKSHLSPSDLQLPATLQRFNHRS